MDVIKLHKQPKKILIIKPSSLGDIVHSLPFLNALRGRFPKSEIHWVVAKGIEGLLEGHPMINRLWVINKDNWKRIKKIRSTAREMKDLFRSLKNEKYDLAVDLQGLLRSGIITAATGAPVRIGFKEAREGSNIFYTHRVKGGKDIHAADRYLKIADLLGCDTSSVSFPLPSTYNVSDKINELLPHTSYAVLVPGARWETKRWPAEKFGKLASMLPIKFIVIGGKSDTDLANIVVDNSRGNAIGIAGKTDIKELIEVMRRAKFVVSNDSGPMHIAAALGVPVFAIFGPTNPARTGPYGSCHIIIRKELKCSPCYKRKCSDVKCMDTLDFKSVADIIMSSSV